MLRNKNTKVFSETNSFFASSEKGIFRIMQLYKTLNLNRLKISQGEMPQSSFKKGELLLGLLLFPLYSINNVYSYSKYALSSTFEAKKNTFYSFKNDPWIKQLKLYCAEVEVEYKSRPIKLYF